MIYMDREKQRHLKYFRTGSLNLDMDTLFSIDADGDIQSALFDYIDETQIRYIIYFILIIILQE